MAEKPTGGGSPPFIMIGADASSLKEYRLAQNSGAPYQKVPRTEYFAPIRLGQPEYDARQVASTVALSDHSTGMGRYLVDTRNQAKSSFRAEADTRNEGYVTLPAKVGPVLLPSQPGNLNGGFSFVYSNVNSENQYFAAAGDTMWETDGAGWFSTVQINPTSALTYRLRSVQYVNTAVGTLTDYLMWCRSDDILKCSGDPGVGANWTTTAMLGMNDGTDIHNDPLSLTRAITMTHAGSVYQVEFTTPAQVLVGAVAGGGHFLGVVQGILYLLDAAGKVHSYDASRDSGTFVRQESVPLERVIGGCAYDNADLVLWDRDHIIRWNPGRPVRDVTPAAPDGLPDELRMQIRGVFTVGSRLLALCSLSGSRNLELNGGMETNVARYGAFNGGVVSRVTSQSYFGGASLQAVTPGAGAFEGVQHTTSITGISVSTTYTLQFRIRASVGVQLFYDVLEFNSGVFVASRVTTTAAPTGTGRFEYEDVTFTTAGAGINELRVRWYTGAAPTATTFQVDCVQLELGSTATPYRETDSDASVLGGMTLMEFKGGGWHLALPIIGGDWHGSNTPGNDIRTSDNGFINISNVWYIGQLAQGTTLTTLGSTDLLTGDVRLVQQLTDQVTNWAFEPEAIVDTGWHDFGLRGLQGPLLQVRHTGEFIDTNQSIEVYYQTAQGATGFVEPPVWTLLGTLTASTRTLQFGSGAGVAFRYARFRQWLKQTGGGGGGQSSDSPNAGIAIDFLKIPDQAIARIFQIDLEATADTTRRTPTQVYTDLITLSEQKTLPVVSIPGEGDFFLKLVPANAPMRHSEAWLTGGAPLQLEAVEVY